uniref:ATP synthase complex subunit 8 n=1 Tax=Bifiditermes nr. madagascariensis TaxID=2942751 RepID=A0A8X8M2G9_9NEOP|nr:ATP synthase F0 subunit 8 [Bifiditermes nr. madagascariensis]
MPQMMPMSWTLLFIMFSMTLIIIATTNYFTSTLKPKQTSKKALQKTPTNWKW